MTLHDPLLTAPVHVLAARVRSGELSPVELVDAHVRRIEAVNGRINALVGERFGAARAEAHRAEAALRTTPPGDLPPLHGIPCTIKEFVAVEGMSWTAGLEARRGVTAPEDSTVVRRLRKAGAIVLGVSNAPEGGLWMETYNTLYGRTRNPYDLRRSPGGSSGGEGALVASGASPFGIGSDVGGSIRIPAGFCGVCGHKGTGGLVPNTGHHPPAPARGGTYLCTGPLARSVDDLALVLSVISGPDDRDVACTRRFSAAEAPPLSALTVHALEDNGAVSVRASVRQGVRDAAQALASRGAAVRHDTRIAGLKRSFLLWSAMLSEAADTHYDVILGDGDPVQLGPELGRWLAGRSRHTIAGLLLTIGDKLVSAVPQDLAPLVEEGRRLRDELETLLGDSGVLLLPVYSRPAPRHRDSWRTATDAQYTAIFNVLELPVTVVPVGFESRGLPLSVQVVGARGQDALTLATARAIEQELGGWKLAEPG